MQTQGVRRWAFPFAFGLILFGMVGRAQAAPLLYIFEYDPLDNLAAASITFSAPDFADTVGDTLTYVSGEINGCAPAILSLDSSNAFATLPIFDTTTCGDDLGPDVDGLYFRSDVMPPLTVGVFFSTETAGRLFGVENGAFYRYTSGSLTIQEVTAVPEPATLGLFAMGLAALRGIRRRSSRRQ